MSESRFKLFLISDFTINSLGGLLNNDQQSPLVETKIAGFDRVIPTLLELASVERGLNPEGLIIWTRPEKMIPAFGNLLYGKSVVDSDILKEVDAFAEYILAVQKKVNVIFVPSWTQPDTRRGMGLLDMRPDTGIGYTLLNMNLRLAQRLSQANNIYFIDARRWIGMVGNKATNPKQWYAGKMAFTNAVFKEAVRDIKAGLAAMQGFSRKLIILDLDNTLWGGVVGEVGWQGVVLGGHHPAGEAFVDFQRMLKALKNRGILLAIVSKNEELTALNAIRNHPEMVLRPEDFVDWRINWSDKAENIKNLVQSLNLGLQSVVFIDDNPFERGRVRETFPEVLVPEWPDDPLHYLQALEDLNCFDQIALTAEDVERSAMYHAEKIRDLSKTQTESLDEWLATLQMKITLEKMNDNNRKRIVQLINKTNQMNLSTRRMTEAELNAWLSDGDRALWACHVSDKYGDSGLTGIISIDIKDDCAKIIDFVVSCRVFKRGVEETMLAKVISYCMEKRITCVQAEYLPTEKNKPCLDVMRGSGFHAIKEDRIFMWNTKTQSYTFPAHIQIIEKYI
ncbi:MAG: HAD-IIIC family phosphatase [Magnetococcus sp. YQC-5]